MNLVLSIWQRMEVVKVLESMSSRSAGHFRKINRLLDLFDLRPEEEAAIGLIERTSICQDSLEAVLNLSGITLLEARLEESLLAPEAVRLKVKFSTGIKTWSKPDVTYPIEVPDKLDGTLKECFLAVGEWPAVYHQNRDWRKGLDNLLEQLGIQDE